MHLILFGFKGCGKTHFGKRLSEVLQLPFIDTDDLLGMHPSALYGEVGEKAFRERETAAILGLSPPAASVIAVGGGAVLNPANVAHLQKEGMLIYLQVSFATVQKRVLQGKIPSFVDPKDPEGSFLQIYRARLSVYEGIPAERIDVDRLSESEVMEQLYRAWYFLAQWNKGNR